MDIQVRNAKSSDLPIIQRLFLELYTMHYNGSPNLFKSPTEDDSAVEGADTSNIIVATIESKVIGYLKYTEKTIDEDSLLHFRKMLIAQDLIVDRSYRGLGIGKKILEYLEKLGKTSGFDSIEIPVFSFNSDALTFYQSQGYVDYVRRYRKAIS